MWRSPLRSRGTSKASSRRSRRRARHLMGAPAAAARIVAANCRQHPTDGQHRGTFRWMAMIANLRPASDAEIERLLANPENITRFLYGADADDSERVVLNKAWHAIHFVLTGERLGGPEPLNFLASE